MNKLIVGAAGLALAAVPATIGLWGNASFSQAVPVRVPASAQVVTVTSPATPSGSSTTGVADDHGGGTPRDQRTEPGDDRDGHGTTTVSASRSTEVDDDHGGETPRDQRNGPGDDRDSGSGGDDSTATGSSSGPGSNDTGGDDSSATGSNSGPRTDDSASSRPGDDSDSHSGSDDSGSDDHGSGGHGSDD